MEITNYGTRKGDRLLFREVPRLPSRLERGREAEGGGGGCVSVCLFEGLLPVNTGAQNKSKHKEK
jgi:hypothetical protein